MKTNRPIEEVLPKALVSLVCKDALAVRATHLEVAFDGPKVFRYKVFPDYKSGRDKKKEEKREEKIKNAGKGPYKSQDALDIYAYLPAVKECLQEAGIKFTQPTKYEADDVMATRGAQYGDTCKVILGGKDKDGYQCLRKNVVMYDSSFKNSDGQPAPRYIDATLAESIKGCKIKQMIDYQALLGDAIDSIPNFKGYGPKTVAKILSEHGSIREWYANGTKEERKFLKKIQPQLTINRKLVTLVNDCVAKEELDDFKLKKVQVQGLPTSWYVYKDFVYPKAKGLFGK